MEEPRNALIELGGLLGPGLAVATILCIALHQLASRIERSKLARSDEESRSLSVRFLFAYVLSLSISIAVLLGVARLRGEFRSPNLYWHWLPWVGLATGLLAPPLNVTSSRMRICGLSVIGFTAAWFLVPSWESLQPGRSIYVPLLGLYLVVLSWHLQAATQHGSAREHLFAHVVTAIALAAAIAAVSSLQHGQLAAIVATSLVGCFSVSVFAQLDSESLRGMMPCAAVLTGGVAFVSYVYPQTPIYEFLLVPFAPAALSAFPRHDAARGVWVRMTCFFVALGIAVAILVARYGFEA